MGQSSWRNSDANFLLEVPFKNICDEIRSEIDNKKSIDQVLSSYKPPIFWKEKDILKQQIKVWDYKKIQDLLVKTYNIEMLAKKNPAISINIITDFILEQAA